MGVLCFHQRWQSTELNVRGCYGREKRQQPGEEETDTVREREGEIGGERE